MIKKNEVISLLLNACPGFQPTWQEHLSYWNGEPAGEYNDAAEFARYIVESYERGNTAEFETAFATIERVIIEGDEDARGLAVVGIIEDIQTISTHHSFGPSVFEKWLLPRSRQGWFEIAKTWEGKSSLMQIVREENQQNRKDNK